MSDERAGAEPKEWSTGSRAHPPVRQKSPKRSQKSEARESSAENPWAHQTVAAKPRLAVSVTAPFASESVW